MKTNQLDSIFSQYIRLRDSKEYDFTMFKCTSCGCILPLEQMECGHFIGRANMATRFDEDNCNGECVWCNRFRVNHLEGYKKNLLQKIGRERMEELVSKSHSIVKLSSREIDELTKLYLGKIKELKDAR